LPVVWSTKISEKFGAVAEPVLTKVPTTFERREVGTRVASLGSSSLVAI